MKQILLFKNHIKKTMCYISDFDIILNLFPLTASAISVFIRHAG